MFPSSVHTRTEVSTDALITVFHCSTSSSLVEENFVAFVHCLSREVAHCVILCAWALQTAAPLQANKSCHPHWRLISKAQRTWRNFILRNMLCRLCCMRQVASNRKPFYFHATSCMQLLPNIHGASSMRLPWDKSCMQSCAVYVVLNSALYVLVGPLCS